MSERRIRLNQIHNVALWISHINNIEIDPDFHYLHVFEYPKPGVFILFAGHEFYHVLKARGYDTVNVIVIKFSDPVKILESLKSIEGMTNVS